MLYDMSLCPENQGRFMERRLDMESKSNSFLAKEPIPRLMGKYAVPCIISLLVGALYNTLTRYSLPMPHISALMGMLQIPWYFR